MKILARLRTMMAASVLRPTEARFVLALHETILWRAWRAWRAHGAWWNDGRPRCSPLAPGWARPRSRVRVARLLLRALQSVASR